MGCVCRIRRHARETEWRSRWTILRQRRHTLEHAVHSHFGFEPEKSISESSRAPNASHRLLGPEYGYSGQPSRKGLTGKPSDWVMPRSVVSYRHHGHAEP